MINGLTICGLFHSVFCAIKHPVLERNANTIQAVFSIFGMLSRILTFDRVVHATSYLKDLSGSHFHPFFFSLVCVFCFSIDYSYSSQCPLCVGLTRSLTKRSTAS